MCAVIIPTKIIKEREQLYDVKATNNESFCNQALRERDSPMSLK